MTEHMEVTLARLEALATPVGEPKPLFGYEVVATLLKHIRELQKRSGELEAGHNQHSLAMHDKLMRALEQKECAQIALAAELQRREEREPCQLFRNEAACFTELVEIDGPYVVEELGRIDCALIRAMDDRRIIGLRIYTLDPAPAIEAPPSTTEAENE